MPKFLVNLDEIVNYQVEVEAADEKEAAIEAIKKWKATDDPMNFFVDSKTPEDQITVVNIATI